MIEPDTWLLLAQRLEQIQLARIEAEAQRRAEHLKLVFDKQDQAHLLGAPGGTARHGVTAVSIDWDPLEKEWDYQLFNSKKGLAPMLGWRLCYHTLRSKGSQSGFPDRVLVRERVIFAELKREKGVPTPAQVEWLNGLAAAGAEVYLWRPSDLDEIAKILAARSRPALYSYACEWRDSGVRSAVVPARAINE